METVFVLLEKRLDTDRVLVRGVYATLELAERVQEEFMTLWEEQRAYRIEQREIEV
jgi:hypothetical protein